MRFLIDEGSEVLEGDQEMWDIICPFRTQEECTKVGAYNCERTYESSQP